MTERRRHERHDDTLPVALALGGIKGTATASSGVTGNVSLGGLFFKAEITQDQVRKIIRAKRAGEMPVDLAVDLRGNETELTGRIAWFDISFNGDRIRFRAGVEITEATPAWMAFIEKVRASMEEQQPEAW